MSETYQTNAMPSVHRIDSGPKYLFCSRLESEELRTEEKYLGFLWLGET